MNPKRRRSALEKLRLVEEHQLSAAQSELLLLRKSVAEEVQNSQELAGHYRDQLGQVNGLRQENFSAKNLVAERQIQSVKANWIRSQERAEVLKRAVRTLSSLVESIEQKLRLVKKMVEGIDEKEALAESRREQAESDAHNAQRWRSKT